MVVGLLAACGGETGSGGNVAAYEREVHFSSEQELLLFVVDGTATPSAVELRERFARQFADVWASPARYCNIDPAGWYPVHRRAVVAHATAESTRSMVGPSSVPLLALDTIQLTDRMLVGWGEALVSAINEPPPSNAQAPDILATLTDALALLSGERPPNSPDEEQVVSDAVGSTSVVVFLVSAAEDASPDDPASYAVTPGGALGAFSSVYVSDVVVPGTGEGCGQACATTPRLEAWASASGENIALTTWQAGDTGSLVSALSSGECGANCLERTVDPSEDGGCRLFVLLREPGPCSAASGWVDPAPPVDDEANVCEVRRLEGAARQSCEEDLSCADCEPGFCFSRVDTLSAACLERGVSPFPRVIAGDGGPEPAGFRLECPGDE